MAFCLEPIHRIVSSALHAVGAKLVGPGRLELPTSRLSGVRSNHLSYGPGIRLDWTLLTDSVSVQVQYLDELEIGKTQG